MPSDEVSRQIIEYPRSVQTALARKALLPFDSSLQPSKFLAAPIIVSQAGDFDVPILCGGVCPRSFLDTSITFLPHMRALPRLCILRNVNLGIVSSLPSTWAQVRLTEGVAHLVAPDESPVPRLDHRIRLRRVEKACLHVGAMAQDPSICLFRQLGGSGHGPLGSSPYPCLISHSKALPPERALSSNGKRLNSSCGPSCPRLSSIACHADQDLPTCLHCIPQRPASLEVTRWRRISPRSRPSSDGVPRGQHASSCGRFRSAKG